MTSVPPQPHARRHDQSTLRRWRFAGIRSPRTDIPYAGWGGALPPRCAVSPFSQASGACPLAVVLILRARTPEVLLEGLDGVPRDARVKRVGAIGDAVVSARHCL